MAHSHSDSDNVFPQDLMDKLQRKADAMTELGLNVITRGKETETPLWERSVNDIYVKRMPDDEDGILRISIGGPAAAYCVIRGDANACLAQLCRKVVWSA